MQARHASLFVCAVALALPCAARAQYAYDITPLDNATTDFHPEGINNLGQISGYAYVPVSYHGATSNHSHAFYYAGGQLHNASPYAPYAIDESGGKINDQGNMIVGDRLVNVNNHHQNFLSGLPSALLADINQNGDVAGTVFDKGTNRPVIYHTSTGQFQYLSDPAGAIVGASEAVALNNSGIAVGYSNYPDASLRATLFSNGVRQDLGQQTGGINTVTTGINDAGDISGYSDTLYNGRVGQQSFLYHNGQYINIGTLPGETNIYAHGISNDGDVIGGTDRHPFIYHNGTLSNLFNLVDPSLGWTNGYAQAINDQG